MKKRKIIYGVAGMLDYQALIKVGSAKMKISFTNGSSNEAGRTPATFSTDNPIIQLAIENSKEFKSGLITKIHVVIPMRKCILKASMLLYRKMRL